MRSGLIDVLQQHANATSEWMITELLKMNEWFHDCLKTCSNACKMEWLCNATSFRLTWKHACKMAEKEKWEK